MNDEPHHRGDQQKLARRPQPVLFGEIVNQMVLSLT